MDGRARIRISRATQGQYESEKLSGHEHLRTRPVYACTLHLSQAGHTRSVTVSVKQLANRLSLPTRSSLRRGEATEMRGVVSTRANFWGRILAARRSQNLARVYVVHLYWRGGGMEAWK